MTYHLVERVLQRRKALWELGNPKYVFVGSVADVLEKHKLFTKGDVDWVISHADFKMPRGSKKFLYEQLRLRQIKEVV
jgi:hypothetical protein